MSTILLEHSYEHIAIMRELHNWDKDTTLKALANSLKEETDKDIYTEEEKTELRKLYVLESMKY